MEMNTTQNRKFSCKLKIWSLIKAQLLHRTTWPLIRFSSKKWPLFSFLRFKTTFETNFSIRSDFIDRHSSFFKKNWSRTFFLTWNGQTWSILAGIISKPEFNFIKKKLQKLIKEKKKHYYTEPEPLWITMPLLFTATNFTFYASQFS